MTALHSERAKFQGKFLRVRRGCQASQRKGLTSGEVRETSGEVRELPGKSGKLLGNPWILLNSTGENFRGSRRKTSGEVWGTSGEVRGLSRSSGEPDSLPATRQICLQLAKERRRRRELSAPKSRDSLRLWRRFLPLPEKSRDFLRPQES